jgi:glucokinase
MAGPFALGIDFGGTKVLAAVVDLADGKVIGTGKKRSNAKDTPDELMGRLFEAADAAIKDARLGKKAEIAGVGVGIAGQVDTAEGILLGAPNLSQATVNLPMARLLRDRFGVPAALRNDVQIAAMGEARYGAGKNVKDFLCIFVGTGVGGAIVRDGKIIGGASGTAGEIGHLVIHANGRLCGCGGRGHLEAYASRTAITKSIIGDLRRQRPSSLLKIMPDLIEEAPGGTALRSGVLAQAVADRDELAVEAIEDAGRYLGYGIASAVNLLNPSLVILGGGVIEAVDLLFDVAKQRARREALPAAAKGLQIVRAGLGDNSGVVGAAILGGEAAGAVV